MQMGHNNGLDTIKIDVDSPQVLKGSCFARFAIDETVDDHPPVVTHMDHEGFAGARAHERDFELT